MAQHPFNKTAIRNFFGTADFPCHRDELISMARQKHAGGPFIKALQQIPKKNYSNLDDIYEQLNISGGQRPRA